MNRQRLTGLVLITIALIAVMSTSALRSRTVAGQAVVHPPPQVGDCWTGESTEQLFDNGEVPVLAAQPCNGSRLGEVVSVNNTRSYTQQDCTSPALTYLGLPASVVQLDVIDNRTATVWKTRSGLLALTFGPDPLQVAAGQLWSACVLVGAEPGEQGRMTPRPFPGTVRSLATTGGASFNRFATCSNSLVSDPVVKCDQSHRYEIFLQAAVTGPSETDSLDLCTTELRSLTGMTDPTADGRLKVVLLPYRFDQRTEKVQPSTYQQARQEGGVSCAMTPTATDQVLTGTLMALYDRPLPIS